MDERQMPATIYFTEPEVMNGRIGARGNFGGVRPDDLNLYAAYVEETPP